MIPRGQVEFDAILSAPFGAIGLRLAGEALAGLDLLPADTTLRPNDSSAVQRVVQELDAYYANPGHTWKLSLAPVGTPYRQRVWAALARIPAGSTCTYGAIAGQLGSSPRAVGQAVGDNPLPIVIPCHRVLAAQGLGGFMHARDGFPLTVKRWLLRHDGITG